MWLHVEESKSWMVVKEDARDATCFLYILGCMQATVCTVLCMVFQIALLFLFEVSKVLYLKSKCSLGWDLVLVKF